MSKFKEHFSEICYFSNDYEEWLLLDAEIPIRTAIVMFSADLGIPITEDEIEIRYVRYGFYEGDLCWNWNPEYCGRRGEKRVWLLPRPKKRDRRWQLSELQDVIRLAEELNDGTFAARVDMESLKAQEAELLKQEATDAR